VVDAPGTLTNIPSSLQKGGPSCNQKTGGSTGTIQTGGITTKSGLRMQLFSVHVQTKLIEALLDIFGCDFPCHQKTDLTHISSQPRCDVEDLRKLWLTLYNLV